MEDGVSQRRQVERGERQQVRGVHQAREFVHVVVRERTGRRILLITELDQQQVPERRRHRGVHLDAHHLGEAAVPDLLLDQAEQVLRLVSVIDLEIGVAGDPEGVPAQNLHAGEERLQVGADDLLERHELVRRRERHPARQDLGHLHPRETLLAVRASQHHGEREAEVRDVREGMAGIDRERRQYRKDVAVEIRVDMRAVHRREIVDALMDREALLRKRGQEVLHQALSVSSHQRAHDRRDRRELVLGRHAVGGPLDDARRRLLLEARDAHLEELIEVAAEDGHKLEPLEQRGSRVERLVQNAPVELEPGELPIEVEGWVADVDRGGSTRGRGLRRHADEVSHGCNVRCPPRRGNVL